MRRIALLFVLAAAAGAAVVLAAQTPAPKKSADTADLQDLTAEYDLAKQPKAYFVLDIQGKTLELRIRGMALRAWPLQNIHFWGRPGFSRSVELVRKSALNPPQRKVIKPGEVEKQPVDAAKFELEALELSDMPKNFTLDFDDGLHVSVKTPRGGLSGRSRAYREAFRWYVMLPVRNFLRGGAKKPLSELEFTFANEKDAQSIYWMFYDGIKGIIL